QDLGIVDDPYVDLATVSTQVGTADHLATLQGITDRTTTLVRNTGRLLPLSPAESGQDVFVTGWGMSTTSTVASGLEDRDFATTVDETGTNPNQATIDAAAAQARQHDLTVVVTNRAGLATQQGQAALVRALIKTKRPVVAVAVRDPYDVNRFPIVTAYLATYSYTPAALNSLVRVLVGELEPSGRLPVTIPEVGTKQRVLYPYGHGMRY
ncbi:MAG TPA: glycoside hydrolase family 3 C-terminal domain-containing protein, partial [Microlunatus sp.]|nr:glycoside hydrolase family 3 C-terminal domain-containing protein [Microlunatus sp.]